MNNEFGISGNPMATIKRSEVIDIAQDNNPIANIKRSTDVAGACKEIVSRSAINIGNKKYVPVEGWMAIATAHGCNLSATDMNR